MLFAVPAIFHAIVLARLGFYKIGVEPRLLVSAVGALAAGIVGFALGAYLAPRKSGAEPGGAAAGDQPTLLEGPGPGAWERAGEDATSAADPAPRIFNARIELGSEYGAASPGSAPQPQPQAPSRIAPSPERPAAMRSPDALGDLSLAELTARLARAIAAAQDAPATAPRARASATADPQDTLRSALEMLSRSNAS